MKKSNGLISNGVLFSSKTILTSILFFIFLSYANAQNQNSAQWTSAGGKMIISGNQNFTTSWASDAYSRQDDNKWWPGSFWDAGDTRQYTPWDDAVKNAVSPKIGEITVLGPGNIGLLQLGKGARIYMYYNTTKSGFVPWTNTLSWSNGEWLGAVKEYNPAGEFWGAIPAGVEITLDIYAVMSDYNNQGGTGEISFNAPQDVQYEVWYFPREGGKVISSLFSVNDPNDPELIKGNAGEVTSGSVFSETSNKWLKPGDGVNYGDMLRTSKNEEANISFYSQKTVVILNKNTRVKIKNKTPNSKKWGISLIAGRLWNLFKGKKKNGYLVETFNSVTSVEGTEFEVAYDPVSGTTSLSVEEGVVNFSCKTGEEQPIQVRAGMSASIDNECRISTQNSNDSNAFSLPFFENFSSGLGNWQLENTNSALNDGKLYWNTGYFLSTVLIGELPMENIAIEFDGYCEVNGFNIYLHNEDEEGYIVILGGWYNTKSGSDIGKNSQNRELLDGKVWEAKKWHHYKIVRKGNLLEAYCDGRRIFERMSSKRFSGKGKLQFDSYDSRIGIDNIRIYSTSGISNVTDEILNSPDISGEWDLTCVGDIIYKFNLKLVQSGSSFYGDMVRTNGTEQLAKIEGRILSNNRIEFTRIIGNWKQYYIGEINQNSGSRAISLEGMFGFKEAVKYEWYAKPKKGTTSAISVGGLWNINQNNGFYGTFLLKQDQSGVITGTANWDKHTSGEINGQLLGDKIEFSITYPDGIKGIYKGTLSSNGDKIINGSSNANNGTSAIWSASR